MSEMSEEQDYIIVTIEDSDNEEEEGDDDDDDIIEDSEEEEDYDDEDEDEDEDEDGDEDETSDDDILAIEPDFQEAAGLSVLDKQMNHPENLKRFSPISGEVDFAPSYKRGRSSSPRENYMGLQELIKNMSWQINHLCGIISNMQRCWNERTLSLNRRACTPPLPVERQETYNCINPMGALQPLAPPELQQPMLRESPPLPRVVATHSLEPCLPDPLPGLGSLPCFFNEGAENSSSAISSAQASVVMSTALASQEEPSLASTPEMMNCSELLENNSMNPDTGSSSHFILSNFETPRNPETSLENNIKAIYYPTVMANNCGQDIASFPVFLLPNFDSSISSMQSDQHASSSPVCLPPNFVVEKLILIEIPGNVENNSQTTHFPALLGNISGPNTDISSLSIPPNFALEKVLVIETPEKAETSLENNSQTMHYPNVSVNGSGPDTASSSHCTPPNFESRPEMNSETTVMEGNSDQDADLQSVFFNPNLAFLPLEIVVNAENNMENHSETVNYSTVLENDIYLGDPRRNIRILDTHLMIAQRKARPKLAACYLARVLFSKEVLMCSSFHEYFLLFAEYLTTVFPKHDLGECGKDWKACVSDINALIHSSCSDAKRMLVKTAEDNKGPTKPMSSDLNDKRDDGASSSQCPQLSAASGMRDNGNFQPHSSAFPEGTEETSIDNSQEDFDPLDYIGRRFRNIQLPRSVLKIARGKSRPELSARYLIRKLFPEDVLIKSNVYGNLEHGMCALNSNRISALREFLQDVYPTCDLSEGGCDWKVCVTAINSCLRSLRYSFRRSMSKSQPVPATASSTEPKPRDDDSADRST
ncbi:BEN domain-containing protein 2 [Talpa occidentalis]|uniref:BEN domain-containing protein 2 n=1 Tax=Talpa occidentalis TaxID=50954 RepID=UPI00188FA360|nr:BEN domain-containing protein 2 [Talpa occidentalis]